MITFTGGNGAWLPSGDVALENTAHEAVRGLLKLKADQIREKIPGSQLLSGRAWGGRVVRKDSDGTVYVLVKYEAEIGLPAGVPIGTLAFNLSSRHWLIWSEAQRLLLCRQLDFGLLAVLPESIS